ncbi:hypothetical protein D3C75_1244260 [compost metagenome]
MIGWCNVVAAQRPLEVGERNIDSVPLVTPLVERAGRGALCWVGISFGFRDSAQIVVVVAEDQVSGFDLSDVVPVTAGLFLACL